MTCLSILVPPSLRIDSESILNSSIRPQKVLPDEDFGLNTYLRRVYEIARTESLGPILVVIEAPTV